LCGPVLGWGHATVRPISERSVRGLHDITRARAQQSTVASQDLVFPSPMNGRYRCYAYARTSRVQGHRGALVPRCDACTSAASRVVESAEHNLARSRAHWPVIVHVPTRERRGVVDVADIRQKSSMILRHWKRTTCALLPGSECRFPTAIPPGGAAAADLNSKLTRNQMGSVLTGRVRGGVCIRSPDTFALFTQGLACHLRFRP
jgi:hypothetical protein